MNQLYHARRVALSGALIACTTLFFHPVAAQTSIPTAAAADSYRATITAGQFGRANADYLVRRALLANRELSSARLDLERGRARLRQAGLRPNPTVEVERSTGRFTGSPDERDLSLGFALPIELGARRQRRIDLAEAELAVVEAEVADRERQLTREVLSAHAGALATLRELQITSSVQGLDEQTLRVVRIRVDERDTAPLELNLLLTEVERLRSRRALVEGRLEAALITLRLLTGMAASEPLRPRRSAARPHGRFRFRASFHRGGDRGRASAATGSAAGAVERNCGASGVTPRACRRVPGHDRIGEVHDQPHSE